MKLVNAYPSYYTGVPKFVNTYIFLPLALTCTFFQLQENYSSTEILQDNQSGQDGLSLENFLRAVSSNPTDCLNRFSVSEWAAKYRGRREERENEGRNGYPFPLNVLSWPFLSFPQQGALIVICYLYIEISEEERSTH